MLLFKPEHVEPILCGEKTQTRRLWRRRLPPWAQELIALCLLVWSLGGLVVLVWNGACARMGLR